MYLVHHLTTTSVYTSSTSKTHSLTPLKSQLRYNFLSWDQTLTLICWKLFSNLRNQSRAMIRESLSPVFICLVWNWRLTDSIIFFFTIMWRLNQGPFWRTASTQYFTKPSCGLSHHRVHCIWFGCENDIITHQKRVLTMGFCSQLYWQSKISRKPSDNF